MAKNTRAKNNNIPLPRSDDFDRFEGFVIKNWKRILHFFIAVVIAAAIAAILVKVYNSNRSAAVAALSNAKTSEQLSKAIEEYPDTLSALSARVRLAEIYIKEKQYEKAREAYAGIIAFPGAPPEMLWQARMSSAFLFDAQGKEEKAAHMFSALASSPLLPRQLRAEAAFNAGRLYHSLGDKQKALPMLKTASAMTKSGPVCEFWGGMADSVLKGMEKTVSAKGSSGKPSSLPRKSDKDIDNLLKQNL